MTTVLARYEALVAAGELRPDAEQAAAASRLDALAAELEASPRKGSVLWRARGRRPEAPKGVYLSGGVGRGKTMLMDLFFGSLTIQPTPRVQNRRASWRERECQNA